MNPYVILLGIIILLLVYVLYSYFSSTATTISTFADLTKTNPEILAIANPTNMVYAYSTWVYVNSWSNAPHVLFSRANNFVLYLDNASPILKLDIKMSPTSTQTISITNNFPIQRWTYVTVSVDTRFVDCYLDGKLIVSNQLTAIPLSPSDATAGNGIKLGTFDARIAKLMRYTNALDPQTVWNNYLQGNGQTSTSVLNGYGLNLTVLQNNVAQGTYSLM
jgi:hypothetical protein